MPQAIEERSTMVKLAVTALLSLILGLAIGAVGYWRIGTTLHQNNDWIEIGPGGTGDASGKGTLRTAISLSLEEFTGNDDIGPADVEGIKGKGKFVFMASDKKAHFGYVMHVKVKPTDLSKVPDKYKHNRPVKGQPNLQQMALVNAVYQVDFTLTLLDKDGFKLQEIKTTPVNIEAGRNNRIQSESDDVVDVGTIDKVATITYGMTILKNLSVIGPDE
jgi:hypothetical protein